MSATPKTADTDKWILEGMHRVLKYREIEDPVMVRLSGQRYCWKCWTDAAGNTKCGFRPC